MTTFEIKEDFLLDGKPFKILSGAIHYFRIPPDEWYHSLYNLKALGFNTVETYVPWNMHEAKKGTFDFSGILDLEGFLETAESLGLYAIVRPSPYICAEWEFGGLPAWLLQEKGKIRRNDPAFIDQVASYYDVLMEKLKAHQLTQGGNMLMMQVENEYGSFGEEKEYLRAIAQLMRERGIDVPFFTSDGPWQATLRAGSLIEDDILTTGNFGSKAKENFASMENFFAEHGKRWPLMCMEFWDGWFNRYNEPIVRRDPDELAEAIHEVLELGSINLYMFHGGTNFGFMNGCSARLHTDLPQVTSYDYGAPLDEAGNPNEKYEAIRRMLKKYYPEIKQMKPLVKESMAVNKSQLTDKVSLFSTLETISQPVSSVYPQTMEELGQNTGYLLYRTRIKKDAEKEKIRIIDGRDRAQVYLDQEFVASQYQHEIGEDIFIEAKENDSQLDLLMENMGRVNYGHRLLTETQQKGLRQGVMADLHFISNWQQYCLALETVTTVDFSGDWQAETPSFYRYEVTITEPEDCYLDLSKFGKGVVFVNDVNIGRFWEVGPTLSLYIPKSFLHSGKNELIIFETEGRYSQEINLSDKPIFKKMKEGSL